MSASVRKSSYYYEIVIEGYINIHAQLQGVAASPSFSEGEVTVVF